MAPRRHVLPSLCLIGLSVCSVPRAHAGCNTIPPVHGLYGSTMGAVPQRLVSPQRGTQVEWYNHVRIERRPCDGGAPFKSGASTVSVTFTPDPADPSKNTTLAPITPTFPVPCASGCDTLVFTMPDTDAALPPADGLGLTGPVRITVETAGQLSADIGRLHQPSDKCDPTPDNMFGSFTVLPPLNDVSKLVANQQVLATLDGNDNVLIPLDHRGARAAYPTLAVFERGIGTFCARRPFLDVGPVYVCLGARWNRALANGPRTANLLQAFTMDGHRILPALGVDDDGALFGVSDADLSVLRLERKDKSTTSTSRFDLHHLRHQAKGPVVVRTRYEGGACHEVRVPGTRATAGIITHTDAAMLVHVHDARTAGDASCGAETGVPAETVEIWPGVREPILEASDIVAATIERSRHVLRVFDPVGGELTQANEAAALDAVIDDYPLAAGARVVYFRAPTAELRTFAPGANPPFVTIRRAARAAVRGDRAVGIDMPGPGKAWVHDARTGQTRELGVDASAVTTSGDVAAVIDATSQTLTAWRWGNAGPSPTPDATQAAADAIGITTGCGKQCSTRVVILASEAREGKSLNGDPDTTDLVPRFRRYDASGEAWEETGLAARDFVAGDRIVAFRVSEREQGNSDLNRDGDTDDTVMHVAAFDGLGGASRVITTGIAVTEGPDQVWQRLGWRRPYVVMGDSVLFLVFEGDQRADLNHDGDELDVLLVIFQVPSMTFVPVVPPPTPVDFLDLLPGPFGGVRLSGSGLAIGDGDADGVLDPLDNCVGVANPLQVDDDYDGLGDRRCDLTYCTDFRPPDRPGRLAAPVAAAAVAYLHARAQAENTCLAGLAANGERDLDATVLCRGSFVGRVENAPLDATTRGVIARAEREFLRALATRTRRQDGHDLRDVIRTHGDAVNAATRVALGRVRRTPALAEVQSRLGTAVTTHLVDLVSAMMACVVGTQGMQPVGATCLGRIAAGAIVPPTDATVARAFATARRQLAAALHTPGIAPHLGRLRSCASAPGTPDCLVCTTWRNAVRAVSSLLPERGTPGSRTPSMR